MTCRERFIRCALSQPIDRAPFLFYFGPWRETLEVWRRNEGIENPDAWKTGFGFDPPVVQLALTVNQYFDPPFPEVELHREGDSRIIQNQKGEIVRELEGKSTIPQILKSPVCCREDWEKLRRERLNPDSPGRFPKNWGALAARLNQGDSPVQLGIYPCGLYGTLRDLMGVEGSLFAFYDQPELVRDIMDGLTDFWLCIYEKVCQEVRVDILHIWEDMSGKQGSLISPALIEEFMAPNYRRLRDFADRHGIQVIQVDTDGNCEELIPVFSRCGVNMMLPFEVRAGCDVVELRKKYPEMAMLGGIDKLEIAQGGEALRRELSRVEPLIGQSGYFPALDHLIPPDMSFAVYSEFVRELRRRIFS